MEFLTPSAYETTLLLALLFGLLYYYFHDSATSTLAHGRTVSAQPASIPVAAQPVIIASAPSSYNRWKIGSERADRLEDWPETRRPTLHRCAK